jgi:beta-N-acetylhexosaminidase
MHSLTLREKIGQLFFIGIPGTELDEETAALLADICPGGVCLFARNIKEPAQTRTLLESIRASLPAEPFLSLDQEGGLVDRLRRILGASPPASQLRDREESGKFGQLTAEAIRILGFNTDFAPVVDVIDADRAGYPNGLHSRSFGGSAEEVVDLAGAFAAALAAGGCLPCLKHFPGLGASRVDSHTHLPEVRIGSAELR